MTFSPSRRRMTRSTPWVAGCCGPILMTSSLASRNVLSGVSRSSGESEVGSVMVWVLDLWLLAAFDSKIDLYPLIVLLQDAVVFAQGMALPTVGQENALQIGMAVELDAEHVEDFPLQPVGGCPDGNGAGKALAIGDLRFHTDAFIARERVQHPEHVELLLALGIVHCGDVHAVVELLFVAQNLEDFRNQGAIDHHVVLAEISQRFDAGAVFAFELRDHGRIPWRGDRSRRFRRSGGWLGGGRGCGRGSRFRWSYGSWGCGRSSGLVGSGFRLRLNRAGRSSF